MDCALAVRATPEGSTVVRVNPGGDTDTLYQHREYLRVVGVSADDELFSVERWEPDGVTALVFDRRGQQIAALGEIGGHRFGFRYAVGSWSPVKGDPRLLLHQEGEYGVRPYVWDPLEGRVRPAADESEGEVRAEWLPDAAGLLLSHQLRGRTRLSSFDLATGRRHRLPTLAGHITEARARPDGEVWYVHSSGAQPSRLRKARPGQPDARETELTAGRPYQYLSCSGIDGFLVRPEGPGPHPVFFSLHGGPATHDNDSFSPRVQAWVDHGYAVVLLNYRGSTGRGKRWRSANQHPPGPGLTELEDLAAVRRHLVSTGIADPGRLVLSGGSWGGYLTLLGLALQPELWSLGIAVVPIADWRAAYEDESEALRAHDRALFDGSFEERSDYYTERSPLTYADRIEVPLLVIYGSDDDNCPPRQVENYLTRLRELGVVHEAYRYSGGHTVLAAAEQLRQTEMALAFARRHLGVPPAVHGQRGRSSDGVCV
ncbi:alpha/beta hydrolase family protein [Kitasatospora sp. NPDC059088]|uniref:alpha/beta hydrolase family protein n=1 Tax=Kitasatospora sp. NPDC059088 TaxID=3346722 RepID=UPI00369F6478